MDRQVREFEIRKISDRTGYGLFDLQADDFTVRIGYASPDALRRDVKQWKANDKWPLGIEWREQVTIRPLGGYYNGVRF